MRKEKYRIFIIAALTLWVIWITISVSTHRTEIGISSDTKETYPNSGNQIVILKTFTLQAGQQDTIWFPLNEFYNPSNGASYNPPEKGGWNGNGRYFIRMTSAVTGDSLVSLLKTCDHNGRIFKALSAADLDSFWVIGTSFTDYKAVANGSVYTKPLTGQFDPCMQLANIVKMGDTDTSRTFEVGIVKQ